MSKAWDVATHTGGNRIKIGAVNYTFPNVPTGTTGGTKTLSTQSPPGNNVILEWSQQGGLPVANAKGQLLVSTPNTAKTGFEWKAETGLDGGVDGSQYPAGTQAPIPA